MWTFEDFKQQIQSSFSVVLQQLVQHSTHECESNSMPSAVFARPRLYIFADNVLKPPSFFFHHSLSVLTSLNFCLLPLNSEDIKTVSRCSLVPSHECEALGPIHLAFQTKEEEDYRIPWEGKLLSLLNNRAMGRHQQTYQLVTLKNPIRFL